MIKKIYYALKCTNDDSWLSSNDFWGFSKKWRVLFKNKAAALRYMIDHDYDPSEVIVVKIKKNSKEELLSQRLQKMSERINSLEKELSSLKPKPISDNENIFKPGDVWRWIDKEEAAAYNCEVGSYVFIKKKNTFSAISVIAESFGMSQFNCDKEWENTLTKGLELVERDGKAIK